MPSHLLNLQNGTPMSTPLVPTPAPSTASRWTVELKVVATTIAVAVVSGVVEVLNQVTADHTLLGPVPAWAQGVILVLVPTAVTFLSGWATKHTPRPDLKG